MNMKWFKKLAMSGLLVAALPLGAQAQNVNGVADPGADVFNGYNTGVVLDSVTPNYTWWNVAKVGGADWENINPGVLGGVNIYNLGAMKIDINTGATPLTESTSAIFTNDLTGQFNLSDINIAGSMDATHWLGGFSLLENTATVFTGKIAGAKNVNVYADGATPSAIGVGLVTNNTATNGKNLGAKADVNFGTINVTNAGGNAAGFFAGAVGAADAKVTLGDVTAAGETGAIAVNLGNIAGNVKVGNLNVTEVDAAAVGGTNGAVGFGTAGLAGTAVVNTGDVSVTGAGAGATGFAAIGAGFGNIAAGATLKTGNIEVADSQIATGFGANLVNGKVTLGDIKAASANAAGNGTAAGVNTGAITGAVDGKQVLTQTFATGNIDVSADINAIGVGAGVITNVKDAAGKNAINFGEIKAVATADGGYAAGIAAGVSDIAITKNITAEAVGNTIQGQADGLGLGAGSTVRLNGTKGAVTVLGKGTGAQGAGYGISTFGDVTVNVDGRANVLGDNGMGNANTLTAPADNAHMGIDVTSKGTHGGAINVNLSNNAHLVTNGLQAAAGVDNGGVTVSTGNITIDAYNDANNKATAGAANARYDVGALYGYNQLIIQNQGNKDASVAANVDANSRTTVSVNLAASNPAAAGPTVVPPNNFEQVRIGDRVNVEVYGDVTDAVQNNTAIWNVGEVAMQGRFIGKDQSSSSYQNLSVFTDWALTQGGDNDVNTYNVVYNGIRQKAYMNDGFLAALMIHQRNAVFNAARDHMISFGGNRNYRGQLCDPCAPVSECDPCEPICDTNPCDPCDPCGDGSLLGGGKSRHGFGGFNGFGYNGPSTRNAWVNYIGRADRYQSSYNGQDWKIGMDGVQVGVDLVKTSRNQLGVIFGYEGGNAYNAADSIKADDVYIGLYGARVLRSGADFRFALSYGWQDYDMNRYSRVLPPQPRALYLSSFEGNTFEANLELGKRVHSGYWSMRPVVALDLSTNDIDGTNETAKVAGMDGPLAYSNAHLTQIYLRTGSDLRFQKNRFTFNSGLYFAYDVYGSDADAQVTRINAPILSTKLAGSELGKSLLSFNVGGAYQLCNNLSVFGGYQGEALLGGDADSYQSIGHVGGAWRW